MAPIFVSREASIDYADRHYVSLYIDSVFCVMMHTSLLLDPNFLLVFSGGTLCFVF